MAFQVSPGVQVREVDLTNVVPAVSTSIGAIAGLFQRGPINQVVTVGSEKELVSVFGEPTDSTYKYFMPAAQFLQYGNSLKVVRVAPSDMSNARNTQSTTAIFGEGGYVEDNHLIRITSDDEWSATVLPDIGLHHDNTSSIDNGMYFLARTPGVLGNSIGVSIFRAPQTDNTGAVTDLGTSFANWTYSSLFDGVPGSSAYAQARQVDFEFSDGNPVDLENFPNTVRTIEAGDELHIVVYDRTGDITGTAGTVLETYPFLSMASDAKRLDDGTNLYYKDVINEQSDYIWFVGKTLGMGPHAGKTVAEAMTAAVTTYTNADGGSNYVFAQYAFDYDHDNSNVADVAVESPFAAATFQMDGGRDGGTNTDFKNGKDLASIIEGYDILADTELVDINLVISPMITEDEVSGVQQDIDLANKLIAFAEGRKDCVAFCSPAITRTVGKVNSAAQTNVTDWANALTSSSYAVLDSTAIYVYDKYNDKYRWINASGAVAGLCANTDQIADAWWSPAGYNRGQLLGTSKIAFNPTQANRDELYKAKVNPIVTFPGEGTILFGDKTALSRPSAFDRINVRRLFIVLEKAISTAAKYQLFEFNDEFTRAQFRNMVEPFLRDVKGRRGITDFKVVCDETNNTGEIIDTNQFVADIYIKPARSINFISLNFIATRTGVEFSEIAGR